MKARVTNEEIVLVAALKECVKTRDLCEGDRLHAHLLKRGLLQENVFLGSALVNAYAKCHALAKAQQVFDELPIRNAISWNVLVMGYAQHGHGTQALYCFRGMQQDGFSPDAVTYSCMLKACSIIELKEQGVEIHNEIARKGLLGKDPVLGSALVDMYAKHGLLAKAQEVFNNLLVRDVIAWTTLITGYCHHGQGERALSCFRNMQEQGLSPNAMTFACILKACGNIQAAEEGIKIHAEIERQRFLVKDSVLWNALVDMYAKCGALTHAQSVFNMLPARNIISWTALIVGFYQQGHGEKALKFYERMRMEGLFSNPVTFAHILQACGTLGGLQKGKELHLEILSVGKLRVLGNALVDMYATCGAIACAQDAFDKLLVKDLVSWNALIAGYCHHSLGDEALNCFDRMQENGFSPNAITCACILRVCGNVDAAEKGREVHAEIVRKGWQEKSIVLGNTLVDMYVKWSALSKAQEVFDTLSIRDVVSWNVLMAGYSKDGGCGIVFDLFNKMKGEGLEPSKVTYSLILNVCGYLDLVDKAQSYFETMGSTHGIVPRLEHHTFIAELLGRAGQCEKATATMPRFDYLPMWFSLLRTCCMWGNLNLGILAFEQIVRLDAKFIKAYVCLSSLYAAAGMQEYAQKTLVKAQQILLDDAGINDVGVWNALIAGYCEYGNGEEALNCFEQMEFYGPSPSVLTFLCILKACGSVGATEKGRMIHDEIIRRGWLEESSVLATPLVDMYAKCGALMKAQGVFNNLVQKDVVSWTALIAGYCQHGYGREALVCFERMKCEGISPDIVTLACILKACSILGSSEKGQMYFETMSTSYGMVSNLKHHTCLVDLLGCAGQFTKVMGMMKNMPASSYHVCWSALVGTCRKCGNEKVGEVAFEHAAAPTYHAGWR